MWKYILEKIDAKLITAGGGIMLAGFTLYVLLKVLTNDLNHIDEAITKQAISNHEVASALRELKDVIKERK